MRAGHPQRSVGFVRSGAGGRVPLFSERRPIVAALLDLDAITRGTLQHHPYRWSCIEGVFTSWDAARALAGSFPDEGFTLAHYEAAKPGAKQYHMYARPLIERPGAQVAQAESLASAWQALVEELRSPAYRMALSALSGLDLDRCELEATFWRYDPGCYLSPHTDKPHKIVTLLLYFAEQWSPAWGGELEILSQPTERPPAYRIYPALNRAAVLVRDERSWHAVAPVREANHSRRSLQVVFHQPRQA